MSYFSQMSKAQKYFSAVCVLVLVAVYAFTADEGEYVTGMSDTGEAGFADTFSAEQFSQNAGDRGRGRMAANDSSVQRVVLHDRGMQMPIGAITLPQGWQVNQDIAHDPQTGAAQRYVFDILGPKGELLRSFGTSAYSASMGQNFQQMVQQQAAQHASQLVSQVQFGNLQPSQVLQNSSYFRELSQAMQAQGGAVDGLEVMFTGMRNAKAHRGVFYITHYYSNQMPGIGTFATSVVFAPEEQISEAIEVNSRIAESLEKNPAFQQRIQQLQTQQHQQRMARSGQQHQQRMARNKALFDAHQRKMQGLSALSDQRHQQYMDTLRGGGNAAGGTQYNSHNAFVDSIHERETFNDPSTGQQRSFDGYYDRTYTNGLGDFVGTDDPSFNQHAMPGDWQEVDPLRPTQ